MPLKIVLTILLLLSSRLSYSQHLPKKANQLWYKSQTAYLNKDFQQAEKLAFKAIAKSSANENTLLRRQLTLWYQEQGKMAEGIAKLKTLSIMDEAQKLCLAELYHMQLRPDSAFFYFNQLEPRFQDKKLAQEIQKSLQGYQNNLKAGIQARPYSFRVNSKAAEYYPRLSRNKQKIYFSRLNKTGNEDFYLADLDSCLDWLWARNWGLPINSPDQEAAPIISLDDHYLFFGRNNNRSEMGYGLGAWDLYMAYRLHADSAWKPAQSFGITINTASFEGMPAISADVSELFFVSNRPEGKGGMDIWYTTFKFGLWQAPVCLGAVINSGANETAPFLSADGQQLFFISDRLDGYGGQDIYRSRRINDTTWTKAELLPWPINTPADEHSVSLSASDTILISSNRLNAKANFDIFNCPLPASFTGENIVVLQGYLADTFTKTPITIGHISTLDERAEEQHQYQVNAGDGSWLLVTPKKERLRYRVKAVAYQEKEGELILNDSTDIQKAIPIYLLPSGYQAPKRDTLLGYLNFSKNVIQLSEEQKQQLATWIEPWLDKSDVQFFFNGFTDDSGTPILNIEVSTQRAQAIEKYAQQLGISGALTVAQGFGDVSPLVPNESEEQRYINRRVEVVVEY